MSENSILHSRLDPTATAPVFVPDPMPPTTPPQLATTITWPDSPPPAFYHNQRVGRAAGGTFIVLGAFFGLLTRHLYFHMTGKPTTVIYTVRACAVATVLTPGVGIYLLVKPYWNDPRYRAERGKQAEEAIKRQKLNYTQITDQYRHLFNRGVLDDERLSILLTSDVETLDYMEFVRRHTLAAVAILDRDRKRVLRQTFLNSTAIEGCTSASFRSANQGDIVALAIPLEEFNAPFREQDALKLPFDRFRAQHPEPISEYAPSVQTSLATSFLQMPYQQMVEYAKDRKDLRIEDHHIQLALRSYAKDHIYEHFRMQHGIRPLDEKMVCVETIQILKSKFLELPYREMAAPSYATDRHLLGISEKEIADAVDTFLEANQYMPTGHQKHREGVLADVIHANNKTKIKEELQAALKVYPEIKTYEEERRIVGLGNEWVASRLREDLGSGFEAFRKRHTLDPLRDRILTADDIAILRASYRQMLSYNYYLLCNKEVWSLLEMDKDVAEIKADIQQKVAQSPTLEKFREQIPGEAFKLGLLAKDDPTVIKLVRGYYSASGRWRAKWPLDECSVPLDILKGMEKARKKDGEVNEALQAAKKRAEMVRVDECTKAKNSRDKRLEHAQKRLEQPQQAVTKAELEFQLASDEVTPLRRNAEATEPNEIRQLDFEIQRKHSKLATIRRDRAESTKIRGEIEQLQGRLNALPNQATDASTAARRQATQSELVKQRAEVEAEESNGVKELQRRLSELPANTTGYQESIRVKEQEKSLNQQIDQSKSQANEKRTAIQRQMDALRTEATNEADSLRRQRASIQDEIDGRRKRLTDVDSLDIPSLEQEIKRDESTLRLKRQSWQEELEKHKSALSAATKTLSAKTLQLTGAKERLVGTQVSVSRDEEQWGATYRRSVEQAQSAYDLTVQRAEEEYKTQVAFIDEEFQNSMLTNANLTQSELLVQYADSLK